MVEGWLVGGGNAKPFPQPYPQSQDACVKCPVASTNFRKFRHRDSNPGRSGESRVS